MGQTAAMLRAVEERLPLSAQELVPIRFVHLLDVSADHDDFPGVVTQPLAVVTERDLVPRDCLAFIGSRAIGFVLPGAVIG